MPTNPTIAEKPKKYPTAVIGLYSHFMRVYGRNKSNEYVSVSRMEDCYGKRFSSYITVWNPWRYLKEYNEIVSKIMENIYIYNSKWKK